MSHPRPRLRRLPVALGALVVVALVGLAQRGAAQAPDDQYANFDRNSPRVLDAKTQLEWLREPLLVTSLADARTRCAAHPRLPGGASGRVPTVKELLTTVDEAPATRYVGASEVAHYVDLFAFPQTPLEVDGKPTRFVTEGAPGTGHLVDFATGEARPAAAGGFSLLVRCLVRR